MEAKLDMMFDMMKTMAGEITDIKDDLKLVKGEVIGVKGEVSGLKGEVSDVKGEVSNLKGEVDSLRNEMDRRFDEVELKIDNLTTETRSYFKRLEDRTNTHESILGMLSYKTSVHDAKIEELERGAN